MDNAIYASLTRQAGLMAEMRVVANNIANANTTGFRREGVIFAEHLSALDRERDDRLSESGPDGLAVTDGPQGVVAHVPETCADDGIVVHVQARGDMSSGLVRIGQDRFVEISTLRRAMQDQFGEDSVTSIFGGQFYFRVRVAARAIVSPS